MLPPAFSDDEQARIARLLYWILLGLIGLNLFDLALLLIYAPETVGTFWLNGVLVAACIVSFWLMRRGMVRPSSAVLCLTFWALLTYYACVSGGVTSPAFGFMTIVIIMGAVLLGVPGGVVFGLLSVVTAIGMHWAGNNGLLVLNEAPPTPGRLFATQTAIFVGLGIFMVISGWSVQKALTRTRQSEHTLAERNRQLQQEIVERQKAQQEQTAEAERGEKQRLELALQKERLDSFKELLGNISHDLKTPVTIINTSLYLLERVEDSERRKEKIANIRQEMTLLEKYIQDLLTLTRLDYAPEITVTTSDLNRLLTNLHDQFTLVAEEKSLTLHLQLDPAVPPILGDERELHRAMTNLVENAIHYTPNGGSVTLQTSLSEGDAVIQVSDTGIGIAPKDLSVIFDRFYRSDQARQLRPNGTGLGLAIVSRIVEMHGGSIEVQSLPGQGTTFQIRLPVASTTAV
jgi:signal transduction histidine kinase